MIVAGIDPGLQRTGYAVLQRARAGRAAIVDAGIITSDQALELPRRLVQIAEGLDAVLDEHSPALVAVEELYAHYRHPHTAILMGHARGLVLLAAASRGMPVRNLSATAIKKNLTGNGRASKAQVQRAVKVTLGLSELPDPPDVADAIAVALAACLEPRRRPR
jgi:crossover junction endodeoxyribonuclease RuvC